VRFSHKVIDVTQTEDGVRVNAETPGGTEIFQGEWMVGADGGRSTVRKCADVGFDGFTWDERFVVASTTYDYAPHGFALNATRRPGGMGRDIQDAGRRPSGIWR